MLSQHGPLGLAISSQLFPLGAYLHDQIPFSHFLLLHLCHDIFLVTTTFFSAAVLSEIKLFLYISDRKIGLILLTISWLKG